jgi:hypothetical protein
MITKSGKYYGAWAHISDFPILFQLVCVCVCVHMSLIGNGPIMPKILFMKFGINMSSEPTSVTCFINPPIVDTQRLGTKMFPGQRTHAPQHTFCPRHSLCGQCCIDEEYAISSWQDCLFSFRICNYSRSKTKTTSEYYCIRCPISPVLLILPAELGPGVNFASDRY